MRAPSYDDLLAARALLAPTPIRHTPVQTSRTLGEAAGVDDLRLKLELFQVTGSFKTRGAYNRIASLTPEERERGVITVSAGNHAQAVAYAAALAGTSSVVVTWKTASQLKLDAAQAYGAETLRLGDTPLEAFQAMFEVRDERGLVLIHPFDDPLVLAGQGTVGLEVVEDVPDVGTVVIPIGGGGLIGGMAIALRELRPGVRIVGVEPEGAPTLTRALAADGPVPLETVSTIADGLSAPFAGAAHLRARARSRGRRGARLGRRDPAGDEAPRPAGQGRRRAGCSCRARGAARRTRCAPPGASGGGDLRRQRGRRPRCEGNHSCIGVNRVYIDRNHYSI